MNTRNSEELIRDFVQETRDELPERVYAAVRREIDQQPQRIVIGPWRTPFMNNISRYALAGAALAAVAIVAVLAITVFAQRPPTVGGGPSPTPKVSAAPSLAPASNVTVLDQSDRGRVLPAGTYSVVVPSRATYTFTLADGWTFDDIGSFQVALAKVETIPPNDERWTSHIVLTGIKAVYGDPCHTTGGAAAVEQSVPAIVTALTHQTDFVASSPVATQLDGASGSTFTIDNNIDTEQAGCTNGDLLTLWRNLADVDYEAWSGTHERVFVLDLGAGRGAPLIAEVQTFPWTTTAQRDEAEQIVSSMSFK